MGPLQISLHFCYSHLTILTVASVAPLAWLFPGEISCVNAQACPMFLDMLDEN